MVLKASQLFSYISAGEIAAESWCVEERLKSLSYSLICPCKMPSITHKTQLEDPWFSMSYVEYEFLILCLRNDDNLWKCSPVCSAREKNVYASLGLGYLSESLKRQNVLFQKQSNTFCLLNYFILHN